MARKGIRLTADGLGYRGYHPLYGLHDGDRRIVPQGKRPVEPRWKLMEPHVPTSGSALDIGSQHGWYTLRMADHGLLAVGVEQHEPDLRMAQWLALYNRSERASFVLMDVDPDTVMALPTVDVVVCMSVFHHWARLYGLEHADAIMRALAERCRDRMFFETGNVDESDRKWHGALDFMQPDRRTWSERFLRDLGFDEVTFLGATRSGKARKHRKRDLLLATRTSVAPAAAASSAVSSPVPERPASA